MEEFFEDRQPFNETVDIMRYVRGMVKRWWLVAAVAAVVTSAWILYLKRQTPVYDAVGLIGFENVGGGIPQNVIESRITRLRSRTFTEEVTAELGLTLRLVWDKRYPIDRQSLFDAFYTTKNPVTGRYQLRFYPSGKSTIRHQGQLIDSLSTERLVNDTLSINGLFFSLKPEAVRKIPQVDFYINGFQNVVQSVLARIQINPNPSGTLMWIVMRDTDPYLASQSVNMLAEKFIQKSRDIRNEANRFQRQYIQEQLKMVQEELNRSDAQLRAFRDSHLVDLNQETQQTVNRLSAVDGYINSLTLQRKTLEELMSRVDPQSPNFNVEAGLSIHYIYQQIAAQPIFDGNAAMAIAKQEMAERTESLDRLRRSGLPPQNPTMREITERIQFIQDKILTMAREKLAEFEKLVSDQQTNASNLEAKLAKLPDEELRLIKLNRQRKANETLNELLLQQYKTAQITESVVSENISIIDPALPPQHPVTGSRRKKALLGAVFGVLLGLGATVIWEVMDRSIRNREDVNRFLHLPILGVIPKVKFNGYELQDSEKAKSISSQIVTHDYSPTPVGEAYRSFRTSLLFSKTLGSIRSLVIASVAPGEGKSFTSANLAITMAQQKSKALLIDADLRRGVLHNSFNCSKKPGLTNYLTGVVPLEGILNETYIPNLSLITCGSMIPNPSEILGSPRMQQFIEGITQRFDIVIFDTPPLLAASDAVVLGTLVDGICMIVMAGKTKRNEVLRKMELFQHVQAKVLGMVLNGAGVEVAHEGYSYYAY